MEKKEVKIRLDGVLQKLSPKGKKGGVVIYTHDAHIFAYQESAEELVYRIDDKRLYDTEGLWEDEDRYRQYAAMVVDIFIDALNSGKLIIEIPFNTFLVSILQAFAAAMKQGYGYRFLFVTFFHSDDVTERMFKNLTKNALERKAALIEVMLLFPFIRMEEIPFGKLLSETYLVGLVQKYGQ